MSYSTCGQRHGQQPGAHWTCTWGILSLLPVHPRKSRKSRCGLPAHKIIRAAPLLSTLVVSPSLYTLIDPCGHKTRLSHKHTDPYSNLDSLIPTMNDIILAALDNVLNDGRAHQTIQDAFMQPPGAAITDSPSLTHLRQTSFHRQS